MTLQTAAQKACYEKVATWLQELFPDGLIAEEEINVCIIPMGSALAVVEVVPWDSGETLVRVWSNVVTDIGLTSDLMEFLLRQNVVMKFGAFGINEDGDIRFEHAIVGSTCDKKELKASVRAVLETADRYDDEITTKWGGRRALEEPPV
ncbi:hypothetical protein DO97_06045 [Neosynechococcus sphagnicola sy1]|uniref:TY-Chap central domain-containing protein n=1 Tax=Neosynechococcus sphagnicola sy1 TaxID=1497020 RepID=A0A098TPV4_9CYAN|nr:YbjN domain-containing protein [Neosynechococcus sphagnicola]KGF73907.1 hypothetical protein DO97_06045 [Neosynechococcus sphagnicola sy1]